MQIPVAIKNLKKGKEYNFYEKDKSYEVQEWRLLLFCLVLECCYNQVFLLSKEEYKMKKYFKIMSLVLSICLLSLNVGFNTYALENDTLYYQGVAIEQKELSEDTLEWLDWYNSLSLDEQDSINYEPVDLQKLIVNSEDIIVSETELGELDIDDIVPFTLGAPIYNPSWWNNRNRIKRANCYTYSMDIIQNFVGKLQPGQLSGRTFESLSEQVSLVLLCVMVLV